MPQLPLVVLRTALFVQLASLAGLPGQAAAPASPDLITAIRTGDATRCAELLVVPDQLETRDGRGNTALHWAALANDAGLVSRLLAAGADARATNLAGATPLHYGTGHAAIVRALLQSGADPNALSALGVSPLHSAAARPNGRESVELLLDAGADVNVPRRLFPSSDPAQGVMNTMTALALAAGYGETRAAVLLLDRGARPGGIQGVTPVAMAAFAGNAELTRLFVQRGGEVNFDDGFLGHALNTLLYTGHRDLVPFVISHGADLHQPTSFGVQTPPMVWSGYTETADVSVAEALLAQGCDINETTSAGHTALDWALKRGETPLVAFLRAHGATRGAVAERAKAVPQNSVPADPAGRTVAVRDAAQRAVVLLQRASDGFLASGVARQQGCISCHHQTLPAIALGRARERGLRIDEASLARQLHAQHAMWSRGRDSAFEMLEPTPDSPASLGYGLLGWNALGYEPDELTAAMVWYLATMQRPDGSFPSYDRRPPLEEGLVVGAAFALGGLRLFPQPLRAVDLTPTFARARAWLMNFEPQDSNQQIHRLLGLGWAGATPAELGKITREIVAAQRPDGGWAALPTLASDAWATGLTLYALHEVGGIAAADERYRRGVDFLLRTQFADGSWFVASRTWPFQPHFDSGFPHGKDQWISAAATAWATIAVLNELEPAGTASQRPTAQALMTRYPELGDSAAPPSMNAAGPPGEDPGFARDIRPIFEQSCLGCHGGEKPKGGLSLETIAGLRKGGQSNDPAIVPGHPELSPLLRFVQDEVEDLEMPPLPKRAKYPALTPEQIATLAAWIAQNRD